MYAEIENRLKNIDENASLIRPSEKRLHYHRESCKGIRGQLDDKSIACHLICLWNFRLLYQQPLGSKKVVEKGGSLEQTNVFNALEVKNKNSNNGKNLEQLVTLIHQTLKDTPKTEVFSNYKIKSLDGRRREFDVFIRSQLNKSPIELAIECKSYRKAIELEKIEAFDSKCRSIPSINKRIFVSESGYQEGAIIAARRLGIELHTLTEIDKSQVLSWFPISQMGLRFHVKHFTLYVNVRACRFRQRKF